MPRSHRPQRALRRSTIRILVALVSLSAGLYFSVVNSDRGWLVPAANNLFAQPEIREGEYDLQALNILNRMLLQVKDNYVEPDRIDPARMLVYALDAIQEEVPQVVAHFNRPIEDAPTEVVLQVARESQRFELGGVGSLWEMSFRLREIFRFVQETLHDEDVDLQLVEYAAINGMLDTLDPHSVLLSPEVFAEMQANNRGRFGGLGIVISIRDGQLTIISPIDGTPAHRAGLRSGDEILKIGEESTINMNIEEAVSRLRGDPGTSVDIEVMREGWTVPHEFTIVRELINIESVKSHVLGDGIGYIEISNFQANTHDDLVEHLGRLRDEMGQINGLVLDLRNNPGGLLEQAIRVSDTFLNDGTIVTTVGEGNRLREEKKATEEGTEPFYPMIVLVNPGSASASEIVAGALQNHGRALIVGDRTFGKGSVQVLYEFQDGSALKLTIAQYLTPGDISIQSVGIVPDIALVPMTIDGDDVDLYPSERIVREGDLDEHLDSTHSAPIREPEWVVKYFQEPEPELDPDVIIEPDRFELDFEIEFAHRLLRAAGGSWEHDALLAASAEEREEIAAAEQRTVTTKLGELGVDWTAGPADDLSGLDVRFYSSQPEDRVEAGETIELTLEVTNNGLHPVHRLRAVSRSDNHLFDDYEFIFGRVDPGETRNWTVAVEVPIEEPTRLDRVDFALRADTEELEQQESAMITVVGRDRPHFAFTWQIIDDEAGNGDGLLQLGESVDFLFTVTNVGSGDAAEVLTYLKNQVEAAILLEYGRESWEDGLLAGSSRTATFRFQVQHVPDDGLIRFEAAVFDTLFRQFTSRDLVIPLERDGELARPRAGFVTVEADQVDIRAAALETSPALALAESGDVLAVVSELEGWVRVTWDDGNRTGWLPRSAVRDGGTEPAGFVELMNGFQPPTIQLEQDSLWTDTTTYRLHGVADDDNLVEDYYIWVTGADEDDHRRRSKILYESVGSQQTEISHEIPLFPGTNRITVVARDDERMSTSNSIYIYRRSPGEPLSNAPFAADDQPAPYE